MKIELRPIGFVRGGRTEPEDDDWDSIESRIDLDTSWLSPDALTGLDTFSHAEIIFHFHQADAADVVCGGRHPRNNRDWPWTGIFAQRAHKRPNLIGVTACHVIGVQDASLVVRGLDAIDGTPVLDIKPYMRGFAPRGDVREPEWTSVLMRDYWRLGG